MSTIILYVVFVVVLFSFLQGCFLLLADVREEARISASQIKLRRPTLTDGVSPWLREILLTAPIRNFDNIVQTCGLRVQTERVVLGMLSLTVVVVLASGFLPVEPFLGLSGALGLGVGAPLLVLRGLRNRRMSKLALQLPETLEMMVRSLKAGHPIPACIALVGKEMPAPVGEEFKRVHDEMTYGLDLRDALTKIAMRLHTVHELKYIASAIKIQSQTGGNLAEILASMAKLMRAQQTLQLKVRAISAEGRMSGNILSALPISVIVILTILQPNYYSDVLGDSDRTMVHVMEAGAGLLVVARILIRRVVTIRV